MPRKKVNFIATQYKNQPMEISFYTEEGEKVDYDDVKKVPTKRGVSLYVNDKPSKK